MVEKEERRHGHKALIIILIIVFVVIVLPIGLVYGLFFDSNTKTLNVDENATAETVGKRIFVDAFDNTKNTGTVDIAITEKDFDNLLYMAQQKIEGGFSQYLKKFYCKIEDKNYNFYLDIAVPMMKTRVIMKTELDDTATDAIILKVKSVNVGRVSVSLKTVQNFIPDLDLQKVFADAGLEHATFDNDTSTLTYKYDGMIADVTKMMGSLSQESSSLMFDMINELSAQKQIRLISDNSLDVCVDLKRANLKDSPYYRENYVDLNQPIKTVIADDLANKIVNKQLSEGELNGTFKAAYQEKIMDTSSNYIVADEVKQTFATSGEKFKNGETVSFVMGENELNGYLKTIGLMGQSYIVSRYVSETEYKINYLVFDNFYCCIEENKLIFVLSLNISGYHGVVTFVGEDEDPENDEYGSIALRVKDIKIGDLAVSQNFQETLYNYIYENLKGKDSETCITFNNDDTHSLKFDFKTPVEKGISKAVYGEEGIYHLDESLADVKCRLLSDGTLKLDVKNNVPIPPLPPLP